MTNWVELTNFAVAVFGLTVVALGLVLAIALRRIKAWNPTFFVVFFAFLCVYVASNLVSQVSIELLGAGYSLLSQIAIFLESLASSLLMPMLTVFLLECAGEKWRQSVLFYGVIALWLLYFILLLLTQFLPVFYYFTPDNTYHRAPLYFVLLIPPALLMGANLFGLWRRRAVLTPRQRMALFIFLAVPLVSMLVQMQSYGLYVIVFGTSASALFMFCFILADHLERYIRQREEIIRQQASIKVLQMRPHFIYNTMMSIYYLCSQNPVKAQQVTLDFTAYLRKNFTAIVKEGTIPFTEELEHTRAYLAVEKVRFADMLFVEFDTPCMMFRVPPLTLQPIVENAVKYGVSPNLDPLYLSVITRETENGSEIVVEDTGPGFLPAENNEPHIALDNIRERLEAMCGGTLEIAPRREGGTRVTIWVPMNLQSDT